MCGIIGYTGSKQVKEILLEGLSLLEYRGYDSAGIAVMDSLTYKTRVYKCTGKVKDLCNQVEKEPVTATCGIGHTRWATHGGVTRENAHPHQYKKITLTHNGIIENFQELIMEFHLEDTLQSSTDSEVAAAILSYYYEKGIQQELSYDEAIKYAIRKSARKFKGTFAFTILTEDTPGVIYAVRNVSPIVAAKGEDCSILASDITAIAPFSRKYVVIPEYHILVMEKDSLTLFNLEGEKTSIIWQEMDWNVEAVSKNGFPFFMEKEIVEQPVAIHETIAPRIVDGKPDFTEDGIPDAVFTNVKRIVVIGCGTAMHAGLVGKSLLQGIAHVQVNVEVASEFIYDAPVIDENVLVIAISQSGETVDTLEALRYAKRQGAVCLSIVNVRGSVIARESDYVLYTNAGPEIAVASTKAYSVQLAMMYLLTCHIARLKGCLTEEEAAEFTSHLQNVIPEMKKLIEDRQNVHHIAKDILAAKDLFMIGRGLDYYASLEGSLKLKEISYIHSEAYSSGELKHGTIALITEETPVIAMITQDNVIAKEMSNAIEVRSRGAKVILFLKKGVSLEKEEEWHRVFYLPALPDVFMVFMVTVALQLLAYYVSSDKGLDVDKPRNLAKVVTVE